MTGYGIGENQERNQIIYSIRNNRLLRELIF